MGISIYLYFDGQCGQAFDHYQAVFGAEEICRQKYSEGPPDLFGEQPADWIMHATIKVGQSNLMGSDRTTSGDDGLIAGNNFAVVYSPSSPKEADRLFPKLADGGTITMPLQPTFWGSYYGLCIDRFGIHWMFNCPMSEESK